jgi:CPA1 family monovalent cation:H+ antiporter
MHTQSQQVQVEYFILLLLLAAGVALVVRRIRLPYTVALVLCGLAVSVAGALGAFGVDPRKPILQPGLVFYVLLPPLLFEAALGLDFAKLRSNVWPVALLATVGVGVGAVLVALPLTGLMALPFGSAILFGAIVAATDPVSVIAIFRELRVHPRLATIIEGESLLNDGTAVVLFTVLLAYVGVGGHGGGGTLSVWSGVGMFLREVFGGAAVGLLLSYIMSMVARQIDDRLVEMTLTTILAYGAYLVASELGFSGVIAVVAAGLVVGSFGIHYGMSVTTRSAVRDFWEYGAFLANSVIFILIGIQEGLAFRRVAWGMIGVAVAAVLVSRCVTVYGLCALTSRIDRRIPLVWRHVLVWGGLRGSIAMALVLGLPIGVEHRSEITVMTFAVVLFTLVVQGMTMRPLLGWLGLIRRAGPDAAYEQLAVTVVAKRGALDEVQKLYTSGVITRGVRDRMLAELQAALESAEGRIATLQEHGVISEEEQLREARLIALSAEELAVRTALREGSVSKDAGGALLKDIQAEQERLRGERGE